MRARCGFPASEFESDGGLNLKSDPMEGLYREALRQKLGEPASPTTIPSALRAE